MPISLFLPLFGAALCLCAPLCHGVTGNGQTPGRNTTTPAPGRSSVRVVEREMLTYPYSAPKEVPDFGRIYPYHRYDGYTAEGRMQKWEMVEMENDYIKLWIMPGVGGKIWGAVDKRTGREFIYFNHVVKFRDVAMRGPWTSGGIEMNFGIIGHSPWCSDRLEEPTLHWAPTGAFAERCRPTRLSSRPTCCGSTDRDGTARPTSG